MPFRDERHVSRFRLERLELLPYTCLLALASRAQPRPAHVPELVLSAESVRLVDPFRRPIMHSPQDPVRTAGPLPTLEIPISTLQLVHGHHQHTRQCSRTEMTDVHNPR